MVKKDRTSSDLLFVKVRNNNIDGALKIFKQRVKESGLLLEIKEKSFYQKKSEKRRIEKNLAKIMNKMDLAISSGGITACELMYLNIPTLLISKEKKEDLNF